MSANDNGTPTGSLSAEEVARWRDEAIDSSGPRSGRVILLCDALTTERQARERAEREATEERERLRERARVQCERAEAERDAARAALGDRATEIAGNQAFVAEYRATRTRAEAAEAALADLQARYDAYHAEACKQVAQAEAQAAVMRQALHASMARGARLRSAAKSALSLFNMQEQPSEALQLSVVDALQGALEVGEYALSSSDAGTALLAERDALKAEVESARRVLIHAFVPVEDEATRERLRTGPLRDAYMLAVRHHEEHHNAEGRPLARFDDPLRARVAVLEEALREVIDSYDEGHGAPEAIIEARAALAGTGAGVSDTHDRARQAMQVIVTEAENLVHPKATEDQRAESAKALTVGAQRLDVLLREVLPAGTGAGDPLALVDGIDLPTGALASGNPTDEPQGGGA